MAKIASKKKGNRAELYIANLLTKRFVKSFKRVPMSGGWATTNNLQETRKDAVQFFSGDIICPPDFKFSVEVKSRSNFNFWDLLNKENTEVDDWISQAEKQAEIAKKEFLLIVRVNNRKPFVILKHPDPANMWLAVIYGGVIYKNIYDIIRLDYLLELGDTFFFVKL